MQVGQREGELQRDEDAGGEGGDTPEGRGDHEGADDILDIGGSGGRAARLGWGGGDSGHGNPAYSPARRAPRLLTASPVSLLPGRAKPAFPQIHRLCPERVTNRGNPIREQGRTVERDRECQDV